MYSLVWMKLQTLHVLCMQFQGCQINMDTILPPILCTCSPNTTHISHIWVIKRQYKSLLFPIRQLVWHGNYSRFMEICFCCSSTSINTEKNPTNVSRDHSGVIGASEWKILLQRCEIAHAHYRWLQLQDFLRLCE